MDGISPARNWRLRWRRSGWMNAVVTVAITLLRPSGQPSTQWIWVVSFDISANGGWCHVTDFYQRNWLLCRNWWCGITPLVERSQVTIHICCVLGWPDGRRRGYGESDNGIHPRRQRSHQLWVGEILSVKSPVMSRNTWLEQAGYGKKSHHSRASTFSLNWPALAGYVVHNLLSMWMHDKKYLDMHHFLSPHT